MGSGLTYAPTYTLAPGQPSPGLTYLPASPHHSPNRTWFKFLTTPKGRPSPEQLRVGVCRATRGTGISTGCASTTPLGLALAPDSPWEDYPCPGTLGLPAEGFLTPLSLLIPTFSLEPGPRRFTPPLRSELDAPLPLLQAEVRDFGV